MIEITKGNPTSEEIAALVAVLILGQLSDPTASDKLHGRSMAAVDAVRRSAAVCAAPT